MGGWEFVDSHLAASRSRFIYKSAPHLVGVGLQTTFPMRVFWSLSLLFSFLLLFENCTTDALPEPVDLPCDGETPTYESDIREIVERTCAYSGCHLGGAPGLYNEYEGLLSNLESGLFRQRVIEIREDATLGMPPDYAPDGRAKRLTEDELMLITCWLEAGYPEE